LATLKSTVPEAQPTLEFGDQLKRIPRGGGEK